MTLNAELALAAREMNAFAARLPEADRPDLAEAWAELTEDVDDARSDGVAELAIIEWRRDMRERLGFSPSEHDSSPDAAKAREAVLANDAGAGRVWPPPPSPGVAT